MDDADLAQQQHLEQEHEMRMRAIKKTMPKGAPGDCVFCDEHSERLVLGACARCRDRLGLE